MIDNTTANSPVNNEQHFDNTEKRIGLVYNSDFSGYQALDFSKIDDIETLLRNTSSVGNIDAFGRLRTSDEFTLADYTHTYGDLNEFLSKTSGTNSTVTLNSQQAKATLRVDSGVNNFVTHQSRMYHNYQPGKSQVTLQSFNFLGASSGTNKRIGLFDDYNGIFFQLSGDGTKQIVLRSNVSGSVYDNIVPQSNWNIDKCDGSAGSSFNLDTTKTQLFYADYQWLGVGRVRVGFVHDGKTIIANEFYHTNNLANVYWKNPNLPVRCELKNYASTTGYVYSDQICSTVISEGGYKEAGIDFAITGAKTSLANGVTTGVFALRLKTGYNGELNRTTLRLGQTSILTTKLSSYEIYRLPETGSVIGGTWVTPYNSAAEYNTTFTSYNLTSGELFAAGFLSAGGGGQGNSSPVASNISDSSTSKKTYLGQNIDSNNSNVFLIQVKNFDSSQASDAYFGIQWREIK